MRPLYRRLPRKGEQIKGLEELLKLCGRRGGLLVGKELFLADRCEPPPLSPQESVISNRIKQS
jgi:hypothetical protein